MKTINLKTNKYGVATITLNRPKVHNAFDRQLISELHESLNNFADDSSVRVVVITGKGDSFSAGADMNWMKRMVDASTKENQDDAEQLAAMLRTLNYLPKPTIARVNGAALGGGLGLVACCDIAIAADDAVFGFTEARLGLAPAVISPYAVRKIGENQARRYFLTAEKFDAGRARDLGLVHEVVPEKALDGMITGLTKNICSNAPMATGVCKSLIFAIAGHDTPRQKKLDDYTAELIARLRVSPEGQEGLGAFLNKRQPRWG